MNVSLLASFDITRFDLCAQNPSGETIILDFWNSSKNSTIFQSSFHYESDAPHPHSDPTGLLDCWRCGEYMFTLGGE